MRYEHELERVVKSDKAKLLWDFLIQTDYEIQNRTQDNFLISSICKSESTKSNNGLLDLDPLKHSIAERTMAKDSLALI